MSYPLKSELTLCRELVQELALICGVGELWIDKGTERLGFKATHVKPGWRLDGGDKRGYLYTCTGEMAVKMHSILYRVLELESVKMFGGSFSIVPLWLSSERTVNKAGKVVSHELLDAHAIEWGASQLPATITDAHTQLPPRTVSLTVDATQLSSYYR